MRTKKKCNGLTSDLSVEESRAHRKKKCGKSWIMSKVYKDKELRRSKSSSTIMVLTMKDNSKFEEEIFEVFSAWRETAKTGVKIIFVWRMAGSSMMMNT